MKYLGNCAIQRNYTAFAADFSLTVEKEGPSTHHGTIHRP